MSCVRAIAPAAHVPCLSRPVLLLKLGDSDCCGVAGCVGVEDAVAWWHSGAVAALVLVLRDLDRRRSNKVMSSSGLLIMMFSLPTLLCNGDSC